MFRTDHLADLVARRAGRVGFGVVLIAGALVLVNRRALGLGATEVMLVSWLAAFWTAAIVRRCFPLRPHTAQSLFTASVVVPSVGIALMLPLLIHMPFAIGLAGLDGYDGWVSLSYIISGPTHLALAYMVARRGARLVDGKIVQSTGSVYLIAVCVSCVPFVVFVLPPFITILTGLPFLALLPYQEQLVQRERAELEGEAAMPRAIAHAV